MQPPPRPQLDPNKPGPLRHRQRGRAAPIHRKEDAAGENGIDKGRRIADQGEVGSIFSFASEMVGIIPLDHQRLGDPGSAQNFSDNRRGHKLLVIEVELPVLSLAPAESSLFLADVSVVQDHPYSKAILSKREDPNPTLFVAAQIDDQRQAFLKPVSQPNSVPVCPKRGAIQVLKRCSPTHTSS